MLFVLLLMIFLHVFDDYFLQGILASMKQKKWWTDNPQYKSMYKYDYIVALFMHSFSWTFLVMLPLYNGTFQWYVFFVGNLLVHMTTDNAKANLGTINLVTDQTIHLIQIVVTWTAIMFAR